MLTAYMRRMRNNNLEIRIAGSSCRIKRSTNGKKEGTGGDNNAGLSFAGLLLRWLPFRATDMK